MKSIEKIDPISPKNIQTAIMAYETWTKYDEQITDRSNYIIRKIAELFGGKIEWWDWPNGGGEINGHFEIDMLDDDCINVDGEAKGGDDQWLAIIEDEEWEFGLIIPTHWITEDFEEELKDGIEKYKEQLKRETEIKKKAVEIKKQKKEAILKSAKQKLTPEERKALKL